jgi:hypothetical protein
MQAKAKKRESSAHNSPLLCRVAGHGGRNKQHGLGNLEAQRLALSPAHSH